MKKPLDENALNQLFRSARTYPTWDTRKVPETMLRELYELAIMGPTSMNCLPARFVFITILLFLTVPGWIFLAALGAGVFAFRRWAGSACQMTNASKAR